MYEQRSHTDDHESAGFMFEDMALVAENWANGEIYVTLRDQVAIEAIKRIDLLLNVEDANRYGLLSSNDYDNLRAMRLSVQADLHASLRTYAEEIDHWINNHQGSLKIKVDEIWQDVSGATVTDMDILPTVNGSVTSIDSIEGVSLLNKEVVRWDRKE